MTNLMNLLPRTKAGQPILKSDVDTPSEWWSMRDDLLVSDQSISDERLNSDIERLLGQPMMIVAVLGADEPAKITDPSMREPDFYDEDKAVWIGDLGTVSVDISRVADLHTVLNHAERIEWLPEGLGFQRIPASRYGVEVDDFNGTPSDFDSWRIAIITVDLQ